MKRSRVMPDRSVVTMMKRNLAAINPLEGYALYKSLKDVGFPQGGSGDWLYNPETDEKVYVPHPSELINTYVADPKQWDSVRDILARQWIENKK